MTCEHLIELERALLAAGIAETCRGAVWSRHCREWVYFDCVLALAPLREAFQLAECVQEHQLLGTHDGQECGFVCTQHQDAIMGHHPQARPDARVFTP